jgi:hypothetical protein
MPASTVTEEGIQFGMISWFVPLSTYPARKVRGIIRRPEWSEWDERHRRQSDEGRRE